MRRSGAPLRPTEWIGTYLLDTDLLGPGELGVGIIADPTDLEEFTHPTLVRTRGLFTVSALGGLATTQAHGAIGAIAVDMDPAGVALPQISPIDNSQYDWYWHSYFALTGIGATADDPLGWGSVQRIEIDSRAMRRLETGEGLLLYWELDLLSDFSVAVHWATRSLVKE